MRFHVAWDSIERENRTLKLTVSVLLGVSMLLSIAVLGASARQPIVIERECHSKALLPNFFTSPTNEEMKEFVAEALVERFDTKSTELFFLTDQQKNFRRAEQVELAKSKMKQVVIVNSVDMTDDGIFTVDADRLISVGDVRSTFKFPLTAKIIQESRSRDNPYGLLLTEVNQTQPEVKK